MSPADAEEMTQSVLGTEHHAPVDPGMFVPAELAMFTNVTSTHDQWEKNSSYLRRQGVALVHL